MPLPDLTVIEWIGVAVASWTVLAIATTSAVCFAANRLKRVRARLCGTTEPDPQTVEQPPFGSDPDDDTVRVDSLPPVPPPAWDDFDEVQFRSFAEGWSAR